MTKLKTSSRKTSTKRSLKPTLKTGVIGKKLSKTTMRKTSKG